MKLTRVESCMSVFCALASLLAMGFCPGGASCSSPDIQADLGHNIGQECCGHTPVSHESLLSVECPATDRSRHECCQGCCDSPFHFGCDGGLVLPNQTKSIAFAAFAGTVAIANNAGRALDGLPSQSPGAANTALSLLRTVILLT